MSRQENLPRPREAEISPPRTHRVVFATEDLGGGTGNHLLSMLKYWDPTRWQAEIISSAQPMARISPGVPVTFLGASHRWLNRYPVAQIRRVAEIRRHLGRRPPDLLHTYFFWTIIYGRLLKRLGVVRHLVENREDEGFSWRAQDYALLRLSRGLPDRVICVSEAVRRVVLEREGLDPARVVVINNGVEPVPSSTGSSSALRQELGIGEDALLVGMVANLRPVKGVSYFLEAIPQILRAFPSARFVVVGRGTEEHALRRQAKALGIDREVTFAGFQKAIENWYRLMDVSVLTSLTEGLSITLLESMSCGLPVVVTRVGGNPELVVDGETGYLVAPRDVRAFADRVVALLRDPGLRARMGQEGRRKIERQFRMRAVAERYLGVYSTLLNGGDPDTRALHDDARVGLAASRSPAPGSR